MDELSGQDLLLALLLGEDAVELDDWDMAALHEEEGPQLSRAARQVNWSVFPGADSSVR